MSSNLYLTFLRGYVLEIMVFQQRIYSIITFRLENGTWTGVVGDLIKGDIDISVAALTMTTEREEGTF